MAAVADVTYGFGCRLRIQPPEPEVTSACHLPDVACWREPDAPRTTAERAGDGARTTRPTGVRYSLAGVLALEVTATVAGCRSFAAIGQWAAETTADKLLSFGLTSGGAPDESTLRKLFARLDADALDQALGGWMWTRTFTVDGRRVIALDGKTVRGARTRPDGKASHLVAAFDHGAGAVLSDRLLSTRRAMKSPLSEHCCVTLISTARW